MSDHSPPRDGGGRGGSGRLPNRTFRTSSFDDASPKEPFSDHGDHGNRMSAGGHSDSSSSLKPPSYDTEPHSGARMRASPRPNRRHQPPSPQLRVQPRRQQDAPQIFHHPAQAHFHNQHQQHRQNFARDPSVESLSSSIRSDSSQTDFLNIPRSASGSFEDPENSLRGSGGPSPNPYRRARSLHSPARFGGRLGVSPGSARRRPQGLSGSGSSSSGAGAGAGGSGVLKSRSIPRMAPSPAAQFRISSNSTDSASPLSNPSPAQPRPGIGRSPMAASRARSRHRPSIDEHEYPNPEQSPRLGSRHLDELASPALHSRQNSRNNRSRDKPPPRRPRAETPEPDSPDLARDMRQMRLRPPAVHVESSHQQEARVPSFRHPSRQQHPPQPQQHPQFQPHHQQPQQFHHQPQHFQHGPAPPQAHYQGGAGQRAPSRSYNNDSGDDDTPKARGSHY